MSAPVKPAGRLRAALAPAMRSALAPASGPAGAAEALAALAFGLLVACAMFWPLPLHLSRDFPAELHDPSLQAWQLAWVGHAVLHQPLHIWDANLFFPNDRSLAFSDSLLGLFPLGLAGEGVGAAIVRYNVAFLLAYAVALMGAYVLARELGLGKLAALVAGLAFAYAPFRWGQSGHLNILWTGPVALSVALLLRGYVRGRPRAALAGWLVVAWQLLITPVVTVMLAYLLAALIVIGVIAWVRRGRPAPSRPLVRATVVGVLALAVVGAWVTSTYLAVKDDQPQIVRTIAEVDIFSPSPRHLLAAPPDNLIWGTATKGMHDDGDPEFLANEKTLFPGLVIALLALAGLARAPWRRSLRAGLAAGVVAAAALSFGTGLFDGDLTWRWLRDVAPGFNTSRTPGRWNTLTSLGLALLAAGGAAALLSGVPRRLRPPIAAVLCALIVIEGSAWHLNAPGRGLIAGAEQIAVPRPPPGLRDAGAPRLELPLDQPAVNFSMLWSVDGFPQLAGGRSGFDPRSLQEIGAVAPGFPDAASVTLLRGLGVRFVVVHEALVAGTPWQDVAARSIAGLGIDRERGGGIVRFDLDSGRRP